MILQANEVVRAATTILSLASEERAVEDLGPHVSPETRGVRPVVVTDPRGQRIVDYSGSYALLIGVSKYTGGWSKLHNVPEDITAVKKVLEDLDFETTVVNDPTRSELREAIENFIFDYGTSPNNRLVMYYAGHGESLELDDGRVMGYLVPHDAPLPQDDKAGFRRKALSMVQFETFAKDIQSKHALFLFDSCFAGTIFSTFRDRPPAIDRKTAEPVRQFITSGTEDQAVPDLSIFRQQLVYGLSGEADLDEDSYVTGSELGLFLENSVTNLSQGAQTPVYGKLTHPVLSRGDFVFHLRENE
jgi:hypothetical protein